MDYATDLVFTGQCNAFNDELEFHLHTLHCYALRHREKKRTVSSIIVAEGNDEVKENNLFTSEIQSCTCLMKSILSSFAIDSNFGSGVTFSIAEKVRILDEVITPCLYQLNRIDDGMKSITASLNTICIARKIFEECLLCIVLLLMSNVDLDNRQYLQSYLLVVDPLINLSPSLLAVLCKERISYPYSFESIIPATELESENSLFSDGDNTRKSIHKKRRKGGMPLQAANNKSSSINISNFARYDQKQQVYQTMEEVLLHFGVSSKLLYRPALDASLTPFISSLILNGSLSAKVLALSAPACQQLPDMNSPLSQPSYCTPQSHQPKHDSNQWASMVEHFSVMQSLLRMECDVDNGENTSSYLARQSARCTQLLTHYRGEEDANSSTQTQELLLLLGIFDAACFRCPANQVHI